MQGFLLWSDEQLPALRYGVHWAVDSVPYCLRACKNLIVITPLNSKFHVSLPNATAAYGVQSSHALQAYLRCLVSKEVNFIIVVLYILQAVCFVPAIWKHIKADLSSYGECEP